MGKRKTKPKMYIDERGHTHLLIDAKCRRNELHFEVQRRTRVAIVESKKYKPIKHKGKIFEED